MAFCSLQVCVAAEEQEAGAAQGRRQLLAENSPCSSFTVAAFPRTTPDQAEKRVPAAQGAPHLQLHSSSNPPVPILQGGGIGNTGGCVMSTAWRIPLACSRGRNSAKESCQSWAVGQGSVLIRAAGPGTGAVAVLQITLNLPTGCPKQVLGVVHRGKPDMKERNFHYFCVKNIPCAINMQRRKGLGFALCLDTIILPAGGSSFL